MRVNYAFLGGLGPHGTGTLDPMWFGPPWDPWDPGPYLKVGGEVLYVASGGFFSSKK